jgi:hypothetical protein
MSTVASWKEKKKKSWDFRFSYTQKETTTVQRGHYAGADRTGRSVQSLGITPTLPSTARPPSVHPFRPTTSPSLVHPDERPPSFSVRRTTSLLFRPTNPHTERARPSCVPFLLTPPSSRVPHSLSHSLPPTHTHLQARNYSHNCPAGSRSPSSTRSPLRCSSSLSF